MHTFSCLFPRILLLGGIFCSLSVQALEQPVVMLRSANVQSVSQEVKNAASNLANAESAAATVLLCEQSRRNGCGYRIGRLCDSRLLPSPDLLKLADLRLLESGECTPDIRLELDKLLALAAQVPDRCKDALEKLKQIQPQCTTPEQRRKRDSDEREIQIACKGKMTPEFFDKIEPANLDCASKSVLPMASLAPADTTVKKQGAPGDAPVVANDFESLIINGLATFVAQRAQEEIGTYATLQFTNGICNNAEAKAADIKDAEVRDAQAKTPEALTAEAKAAQARAAAATDPKVKAAEDKLAERKAAEAKAAEAKTPEVKAAEAKSLERKRVEARAAEARTGRALFPATCNLVSSIDATNVLLVPGEMLRQTVAQDLRSLPGHLAKVIEDSEPALVEPKDPVVCALYLAHGISDGLDRRQVPLTLVLGAIEQSPNIPACERALFFPRQNEKPQWTPSAEAARSTLRLLAAHLKDNPGHLQFDSDRVVKEIIAAIDAAGEFDASKVEEQLQQLAPLVLRLNRGLKQLNEGGKRPEEQAPLAREVVAASVDLLRGSLDAMAPLNPEGDTKEVRRKLSVLLSAASELLAGRFSEGITTLVAGNGLSPKQEPFATLIKFSSLTVAIANARTSDDVAGALRGAAVPVGSWLKKRHAMTFGFGGRVGFFAGREWVVARSGQVGAGDPGGTIVGLRAPVGLDWSFAPLNQGGTVGLFLHPIDLGTLVSARFNREYGAAGAEQVAKTEAKIGFAQILSLGGELYYGIAETPLVLSAGLSYSPAFRPVASAVEPSMSENRDVFRATVGLSVDVPIFLW